MRETPTTPCAACPVEVRGLYAAAHNAAGAIERALDGTGEWDRALRKLAELKEAIETMKPIVEKHFDDPKHWPLFGGNNAAT